ncbi:MAG: hypothetical protein WBP26_01070 [Candidatus Saccharimonadales bacterium]
MSAALEHDPKPSGEPGSPNPLQPAQDADKHHVVAAPGQPGTQGAEPKPKPSAVSDRVRLARLAMQNASESTGEFPGAIATLRSYSSRIQ